MAIKARKRRNQRDRMGEPYAAATADGAVCLVELVSDEDADPKFAAGSFKITRFFDHGEHCGHDHGPPEHFGPFETRQSAMDYASANLGAQGFRKVK